MRVITQLFVFVILTLGLSTASAQVGFIANDACYGEQTALADTTNPSPKTIASWAWDFDNDGTYDDGWGQTANYIFATSGSVPVGLKITYTDLTADSTTRNIQVNPLPEVNFFVNNLCDDDSATFTDNSSIQNGTIVSYFWDFNNDGNADEVGAVAQYNHGVPGLYVTKLECVSDAGCSSTTAKQNEVYAKPVSSFNTSGSSMVGESTFFTNSSSIPTGSIDIYVWDFGDGEGSSILDPTHNFKAAQTYTVQLVTISNQDCRDTLTQDIEIGSEVSVNGTGLGVESEVVTPNGDGINDVLVVSNITDYTGCSVTIFSRWNDEVYNNAAYDNDELNGFSGIGLDDGAYYYIIRCDDTEVMGTINILRGE